MNFQANDIFNGAILAQEDVIILDENFERNVPRQLGGLGANVEVWICVVLNLQLDLTIYWGGSKNRLHYQFETTNRNSWFGFSSLENNLFLLKKKVVDSYGGCGSRVRLGGSDWVAIFHSDWGDLVVSGGLVWWYHFELQRGGGLVWVKKIYGAARTKWCKMTSQREKPKGWKMVRQFLDHFFRPFRNEHRDFTYRIPVTNRITMCRWGWIV